MIAQCVTCCFLIVLAATFAFIKHYTIYYMCVNAIGMFVLYSTLNTILTIGSIELKDVAALHDIMWKVLIVFSAMTTIILT